MEQWHNLIHCCWKGNLEKLTGMQFAKMYKKLPSFPFDYIFLVLGIFLNNVIVNEGMTIMEHSEGPDCRILEKN